MLRSTRCSISGWCLTLLASIAISLAIATPAASQTVPFVEAGKAFKVAFDHDGLNVTSYPVLLNGKQVVEAPIAALANGTVTVDMAALPAGSYQLVAVARNAPTVPFTNPTESASPVYVFEARTTAPKPNPPAWRATVLIFADGRRWIESIVPVASTEELPEVLRLLADGRARVERVADVVR